MGVERAVAPRLDARDDCIEVTWPDGAVSRFLHYWLRENCCCAHCTHPDAWERTLDFLSIPLDIKPATLDWDSVGLRLTWPAAGNACVGSAFSWDWLDRHRCERTVRLARKPRPRPWRAATLAKAELAVDYGSVMRADHALETLLELVDKNGIAFVTDMPTGDLAVAELAGRIAFVEESHFGRVFDVESKWQPENLAYTAHALPPHNDLPSRQHLPGVQLLHCRRNSVEGGHSVFVDGIAAAHRLRRESPAAFELLSTCSVRFTSIADTWEIVNRAPIITTDADGDIVGTRLHPALMGPVDVDPGEQADFYAAHRALLSIAVDPEMRFVCRLEEGDCVLFDNGRVLHARTAFDPGTGSRHLQGCYVGMDDLRSRLNVLRRGARAFRLR